MAALRRAARCAAVYGVAQGSQCQCHVLHCTCTCYTALSGLLQMCDGNAVQGNKLFSSGRCTGLSPPVACAVQFTKGRWVVVYHSNLLHRACEG